MTAPRMPRVEPVRVVVGVDTHKDAHVARAKDGLGRSLDEPRVFPATRKGYAQLLEWARSLGELDTVGIEGTGSYGAGLARYLAASGVTLLEVVRPNRQRRRRNGKSDPADADAAASAVLSGEASGTPKRGDGAVEAIRALRVARSTAVKARTQAINALKALLVTAPAELRERLEGELSSAHLVAACARLRPGRVTDPVSATKAALVSLARRYQDLTEEAQTLGTELDRLTELAAPKLRARYGVGPDVAAALLIAAGDNPERLRSEAAFSMLCGSSPVEASSGKVTRHRLNRAGDRQANAALYRVVLVRLRWHEPTKAYLARRVAEGKSKKEAIRCLKRYVAREVFRVLQEMKQAVADAEAA